MTNVNSIHTTSPRFEIFQELTTTNQRREPNLVAQELSYKLSFEKTTTTSALSKKLRNFVATFSLTWEIRASLSSWNFLIVIFRWQGSSHSQECSKGPKFPFLQLINSTKLVCLYIFFDLLSGYLWLPKRSSSFLTSASRQIRKSPNLTPT